MAIGLTLGASFASTTDATSFTTSVFTTQASQLLVAMYGVSNATVEPVTPTVTGHSATWFLIDSFLSKTLPSTFKFFLYACRPPNSSSGGVNFSHGGVTQTGFIGAAFTLTGTDVENGVVQCFPQVKKSPPDVSGVTSGGVTLDSPGHVNNRPFVHFFHGTQEVTTPAAGWTEIQDLSHTGPSRGGESQWHSSIFDTGVSASWATASSWGCMAFEVKAQFIAGGGGWPDGPVDKKRLEALYRRNYTVQDDDEVVAWLIGVLRDGH